MSTKKKAQIGKILSNLFTSSLNDYLFQNLCIKFLKCYFEGKNDIYQLTQLFCTLINNTSSTHKKMHDFLLLDKSCGYTAR